MPSGTGNSPKNDTKQGKKQQKKTIMTLIRILSVAAVTVRGYVVWKYRATLAAGGVSAERALGPVISRVMPAIVLGILSMIVGPEGAILGVPVGAIFGPELLGILGSLLGETAAKQIGEGVVSLSK